MKRLFTVLATALTMAGLSAAPVGASTLSGCLAQHHVCVASDGRGALSLSQQDELKQQIGSDPIYIVVAASGSGGYDSAMRQIINDLSDRQQFVVGFLDTRLHHFGADSRGLLPGNGAAQIATTAVQDHRSDPVAALTEFVTKVKQEEGTAPGTSTGSSSSAWIPVVIAIGVLLALGVLVSLLIIRPRRARKQRQLKDAKAAAQDDLLALQPADHRPGHRRRHPAQPGRGHRAGGGTGRV